MIGKIEEKQKDWSSAFINVFQFCMEKNYFPSPHIEESYRHIHEKY